MRNNNETRKYMAGMRVHELAKEFDMTSKELLARLAEMKIPASKSPKFKAGKALKDMLN